MPNCYTFERPDLQHFLHFYFLLDGSVPSIRMKGLKCLPNSKIKLFQENKEKIMKTKEKFAINIKYA
jgi:hypothetical protein